MNIEQALEIGQNMEQLTPGSMPTPEAGVTIRQTMEALHILAISWPLNKVDADRRPCDCPQGSLCGFFNIVDESCQYGEI